MTWLCRRTKELGGYVLFFGGKRPELRDGLWETDAPRMCDISSILVERCGEIYLPPGGGPVEVEVEIRAVGDRG